MQNYKKALEDAQREMAIIDAQMATLQKRHAQLETTIASLKSLMGEDQADPDRTLTDVVRTILMGREKFTGAGMIGLHVRSQGLKDVNQSSVVTILNRLARNGEIIQGETEDGKVGYKWNPDYAWSTRGIRAGLQKLNK